VRWVQLLPLAGAWTCPANHKIIAITVTKPVVILLFIPAVSFFVERSWFTSLRRDISFCHCCVKGKRGRIHRVRYWETVWDNLRKAGWNRGCISITDHEGRQFWVAVAEREDAGRFIKTNKEAVDHV
jgi:hypothetical protein